MTAAGPRRGGAVLGQPIAHSLSPVLHAAAYAALGLDGWTYRAIECDAAALDATLRALDAEGLAGVSLTMPLKRAVLPLLARTEPLAAAVGAVNTVVFGGAEGEWWGANTDVPGMVAALASVGMRRSDSACVLGGGATATSALAALRDLGVGSATVLVRRPEAASDLLAAAARLGVTPRVAAFDTAPGVVVDADVVVATTPAGATDALAAAVDARLLRGRRPVLFDVVYAPWPTRLAAVWEAAGAPVVGGLELLVEQAAMQVRLMTGRDAPVDAMRAAGRAALTALSG